MKRIGGLRRKTRAKLSKSVRNKGKISLRRFFARYKEGEKVYLVAEPAYQKGMYKPRFYGKHGEITGMQGRCYTVKIKDGGKNKVVIVHPVHLKRV